MMNFILVPTDFSETAKNASRYAIGLAAEMGAKVLFIYAAPLSVAQPTEDYHPLHDRDTPPETAVPVLMKDLEVKLGKYSEEMKEQGRDAVETFYSLRRGTLVEAIEDVTKEEKIEMIVMGTQGASGLQKVFIGSNTVKVIDDLDIPVLAVPGNAKYRDVNKILYAEDLRKDEMHSIKQLVRFAEYMDAELMVTHVYKEDESNLDERSEVLMEKFKNHSHYRKMNFYQVKNDDVVEGIEMAARKYSVDMIAMQTRRRNFMKKLFSSSLTKKLAYHTDIPLLAMHL